LAGDRLAAYGTGTYLPTGVKTINGLAIASVKTINGLATVSVEKLTGL
jgi:hypothetical protein